MVLNPGKCHYLVLGNRSNSDTINLNETKLASSSYEKLFGILIDPGPATPRGPRPPTQPPPDTFLRSKKKKGDKGKKERDSKKKLLKGCQQGQNIIVLAILVRLELKNSVFHGPSTLKSILSAL